MPQDSDPPLPARCRCSRFGRGTSAKGRMVGESTETLRDIYHTLFGLGSLMQVGGHGKLQ